LKAKLECYFEKNRVKIQTQDQLLNFPKDSLVNYITKEELYKSGGFLKAVRNNYFVL
jgi:hypothetical protein